GCRRPDASPRAQRPLRPQRRQRFRLSSELRVPYPKQWDRRTRQLHWQTKAAPLVVSLEAMNTKSPRAEEEMRNEFVSFSSRAIILLPAPAWTPPIKTAFDPVPSRNNDGVCQ